MARFFFDFCHGKERETDSDGIDLPNVEQAYLELFETGQDMWSELLKQRRDPRRYFFEVRNVSGDLLFTFPLQEVLDSCMDRVEGGPKPPAFKRDCSIQETINRAYEIGRYAARIHEEYANELRNTQSKIMETKSLLRPNCPEIV